MKLSAELLEWFVFRVKWRDGGGVPTSFTIISITSNFFEIFHLRMVNMLISSY